MNPYTLFFGYRFVFGFSSEGEHKVRPYIGFGHWLDFGIFSRQHFPLTCTYALLFLDIKSYNITFISKNKVMSPEFSLFGLHSFNFFRKLYIIMIESQEFCGILEPGNEQTKLIPEKTQKNDNIKKR